MTRKQRIETALGDALRPAHLAVSDESHRHSGPPGRESHFNVTVVSEQFEGQSRLGRHRTIHDLLADELRGGLHALTLTLLTPAEYEARGGVSLASPACHSKKTG